MSCRRDNCALVSADSQGSQRTPACYKPALCMPATLNCLARSCVVLCIASGAHTDSGGLTLLRTDMEGRLKPMFVQFVLQTVWHVYASVVVTPDEAQRGKILSTLTDPAVVSSLELDERSKEGQHEGKQRA